MEPVAFRHYLHQNPDLSGQEHESLAFIKQQLGKLGYDGLEVLGETSLLLPIEFATEGPTILIRADFDALPISEDLDLEYRSQNEGVSHKCGHDGHAAILYSLAIKLKEVPLKQGRVLLLWQASEENGEGARKVLEDPKIEKFPYDEAFALHNIPGEPLTKVLCKSDNFTAGVRSISFKFKGLESHAATPKEGKNPAQILSNTLALAQQLDHDFPEDEDYAVITPVYAQMGAKDYGISPARAEAHFTLRTWSGELLNKLCEKMKSQVEAWCEEAEIELEFQSFEEFWPNINTAKSAELIVDSAAQLNLDYQWIDRAFSWGEDFGLFTKHKAGAMFGIGSGKNTPVLHHPDYNFPDDLIEPASQLFYQILKNRFDGEH